MEEYIRATRINYNTLSSWEMGAAEQLMQLSESGGGGSGCDADAASVNSNSSIVNNNRRNMKKRNKRPQQQGDSVLDNISSTSSTGEEEFNISSINHEERTTTSGNSNATTKEIIIRSTDQEVNSVDSSPSSCGSSSCLSIAKRKMQQIEEIFGNDENDDGWMKRKPKKYKTFVQIYRDAKLA